MTDNGAPRAVLPVGGDMNGMNASRPTPGTGTLASRKKHLRTELRARRRARRDTTDAATRAAHGQALLDALRPALAHATCVASFEPTPTESNLAPVNAHVLATGRLLVPITLDDLDLSWRDAATGDDVGRHGIAAADLIVAPALAIGPHGERLGQGGGCYDRALPRRTPGTPVIAVVFPDEFGLTLAMEAHDETVDAVVTVNGITRFTDRLRY